jgi:hypothetical protein
MLEHLFYIALIFIALPSVPFNRVAAVVIGVWVFEKYSYTIGFPLKYGDLIGDTAGLVFALAFSFAAYRPSNMVAAVMFAPMVACEIAETRGYLHPYYCYWMNYVVAMVQVLALPGGNDWKRARKTWQCYRRSSTVDWMFRLYHAV